VFPWQSSNNHMARADDTWQHALRQVLCVPGPKLSRIPLPGGSMGIEINGMAHVILTVSDFPAARAFYGKLLVADGDDRCLRH
jgi:hypothetical protein